MYCKEHLEPVAKRSISGGPVSSRSLFEVRSVCKVHVHYTKHRVDDHELVRICELPSELIDLYGCCRDGVDTAVLCTSRHIGQIGR